LRVRLKSLGSGIGVNLSDTVFEVCLSIGASKIEQNGGEVIDLLPYYRLMGTDECVILVLNY
jgi:hypothetical protein